MLQTPATVMSVVLWSAALVAAYTQSQYSARAPQAQARWERRRTTVNYGGPGRDSAPSLVS